MPRRVCSASRQKRRLPPWSVCSSDIRKRPLRSPLWRISGSPPFPWGTAADCAGHWGVPADEVALRFQLLRLPGDFGDFPFRNIHGSLLRYIVVCATIVPCSIPGCHTELQLKSLEKILIARMARSSYETCFVISFLINHKTGSAFRRCLPD